MLFALWTFTYSLTQVILRKEEVAAKKRVILDVVVVLVSVVPLLLQLLCLVGEIIRARGHRRKLVLQRSITAILGHYGDGTSLLLRQYCKRPPGHATPADFDTRIKRATIQGAASQGWKCTVWVGQLIAQTLGKATFGDAFSGEYQVRYISVALWLVKNNHAAKGVHNIVSGDATDVHYIVVGDANGNANFVDGGANRNAFSGAGDTVVRDIDDGDSSSSSRFDGIHSGESFSSDGRRDGGVYGGCNKWSDRLLEMDVPSRAFQISKRIRNVNLRYRFKPQDHGIPEVPTPYYTPPQDLPPPGTPAAGVTPAPPSKWTCGIWATGSKDNPVSKLYFEKVLEKTCTLDAVEYFCKVMAAVDDDTFFVTKAAEKGLNQTLYCSSLHSIMEGILDGEKVKGRTLSGASYC